MKFKTLAAAVFIAVASTSVNAAGIDDVVSALEAQGYTVVEVQTRGGEVKIEATLNGYARALVYNQASGALLRDEIEHLEWVKQGNEGEVDQGRSSAGDDDDNHNNRVRHSDDDDDKGDRDRDGNDDEERGDRDDDEDEGDEDDSDKSDDENDDD